MCKTKDVNLGIRKLTAIKRLSRSNDTTYSGNSTTKGLPVTCQF